MAYKILFICNKSPWPPKEGGPMAMNQLIEGLSQKENQVKVMAVNSYKYKVNVEDIPKAYRQMTQIELVSLDLKPRLLPALYNWIRGRSYHVQRFISKTFETKLQAVLKAENFDIVQLETLFMTPYIKSIRQNSQAKIVLRAHNIEHLIWKRISQQEKSPLRKIYLTHLYKTLEKYEREALSQFDGIVPISEQDALYFKANSSKPVKSIPFGLETANTIKSRQNKHQQNTIVHIGAMNWMPNEEGIRWFLNRVWPLLLDQVPDAKLRLAGREMPQWLLSLNTKGVEVLGEVKDAGRFLQSGSISIAPLLSGSGIRIKILESMMHGLAVVSTSMGAEGIRYDAGKNILIADTPEAFAKALQFLIEHPDKASKIGQEAQALIAEKYHAPAIIQQLQDFYREIL
jgi:glycosyltransferase involved in cell wall biosynthesis